MRKVIFLFFMICAVMPGWAGEDVSAKPQMVAGRTGTGSIKKVYVNDRYTIDEETKAVKKALNVFKKKAKTTSFYRKKVRIYDALNPHNQSFLSFMTNDQNEGIVVAPTDDFVYYVGVETDGSRRLWGYSIELHERFSVSDDVDRFFIETCEDVGTNYLVVLDRQEEGAYSIYDLDGNSVVLPDMPVGVDELKSFICY